MAFRPYVNAAVCLLALTVAGATLLLADSASAASTRSRSTTAEFQHQHPCASTGKTSGACPGYVKDHVTPLCAGGPDTPSNMQWQTTADAKRKDAWERDLCRKKGK